MSGSANPDFNGITLERGDVLLKRAEFSFSHFAIALGQKIGGSSKATTVHAAISLGDDLIAESSGAGVERATLNGLNTWKVYRLARNDELAKLAATIALHLTDRAQRTAGFGQYGTMTAVASAFYGARGAADVDSDIVDYTNQVLNEQRGATREFFCSNFVVQCFSIASEFQNSFNAGMTQGVYMLPLDHERSSPADMAEFFEGGTTDWYRVGEIRG